VATAWSVAHGALGMFIGIVLAVKIAVIRRFRRFGHRLPWIGGTLAVSTVVVSALGILPAWTVMQPRAALSGTLARGREVVSRKCTQCHGASVIAAEREDARKWGRITREMQRFSRTIPGKEEITEEERVLAAAYLAHVLGEEGDEREQLESEVEENDVEEDGGKSRGRGRGGR